MLQGSESHPSLDGGRRSPEGRPEADIGKVKEGLNTFGVRQSIRNAKANRCPTPISRHLHAYSTSTERSYKIPCSKWTCPVCGFLKQSVAAHTVLRGMEMQRDKGHKLRFMTLTEDPKNRLDIPGVKKAWNHLRTILRQEGLLDQYACVLEETKKGRPHLHVIATGKYIWQPDLVQFAKRAGFGRVADIRAIRFDLGEDDERSAFYVSKEMAGYVSKAKNGEVKLVAQRRRPLRTSRGWFPGGMEAARQELLARWREEAELERDDPGPYWFVQGHHAEMLTIQGRDEHGQKWKVWDRPTVELFEDEKVSNDAERSGAAAKLREKLNEADELRKRAA